MKKLSHKNHYIGCVYLQTGHGNRVSPQPTITVADDGKIYVHHIPHTQALSSKQPTFSVLLPAGKHRQLQLLSLPRIGTNIGTSSISVI